MTPSRSNSWCVALLCLAGCGAKAAVLKSQASRDLGCPVESIQTHAMQEYVEGVNACGKQNAYVYDHEGGRWIPPTDRASFDLDCPKQQLQVQLLDNRSVGVIGCGRKAVYVLSQTTIIRGGKPAPQYGWVSNATFEPSSGAAPNSAPTTVAPAAGTTAATPSTPPQTE